MSLIAYEAILLNFIKYAAYRYCRVIMYVCGVTHTTLSYFMVFAYHSLEFLRLDKDHIFFAFRLSRDIYTVVYARGVSCKEVLFKGRIHNFEYLSCCSTWTYDKRIGKYYVLQFLKLQLRQIDISKQSKGFSKNLADRVWS